MTKSCAARWPSLASAGGQFAASLRAAVPIDVAYGGGQQVELRLPILAVAVEPDRGVEDRPSGQATAADAPGPLLSHQPGAHQHLDVLRHRLQRDVEMLRDLRHQELLPVETAQDGAAYRIGKRRKHLIERVLAVVRGAADKTQVGEFGDHGASSTS